MTTVLMQVIEIAIISKMDIMKKERNRHYYFDKKRKTFFYSSNQRENGKSLSLSPIFSSLGVSKNNIYGSGR